MKVKFNNTEITLPEPQDLTVEHNKIWSANTGRLDSGYFVGDLIAIKRKLNITWGPCNKDEAKLILDATKQQFVGIEYTTENKTTGTGEFYWGDLSGDYYNLTIEKIMSGFSCNAIER